MLTFSSPSPGSGEVALLVGLDGRDVQGERGTLGRGPPFVAAPVRQQVGELGHTV
jgi:hypothetical protein